MTNEITFEELAENQMLLKNLRKIKKISQSELAKKLSIDQSLISKVEKGKRELSAKTLLAAYKFLKGIKEDKITLLDISTKAETVTTEQTLKEVADLFDEKGYSQMPIINKKGQLYGSITELTLLKAIKKYKRDWESKKLREVYDPIFPIWSENTSVDTAIDYFYRNPDKFAILIRNKKELRIITRYDIYKKIRRKVVKKD